MVERMGMAFLSHCHWSTPDFLPFSLCFNSNMMKSRIYTLFINILSPLEAESQFSPSTPTQIFPVIWMRGDQTLRMGLDSRKAGDNGTHKGFSYLIIVVQAPPSDSLCSSCCGRPWRRAESKCVPLLLWTYASRKVDQIQSCVRYNNRNKEEKTLSENL